MHRQIKCTVTLGKFCATCLTILLQNKLYRKFPGVTCLKMNMSCNVFVVARVAQSSLKFSFSW